MYKIIGAFVVLFIYAVLVQFTNLIVYGYDFTALLIPLVITFLYFTVTLWWGKRKLAKEVVLLDDELETQNGDMVININTIEELRNDYALEVKKNEQYDKLINVGDTVKVVSNNRNGKVQSIKLENDITEYRLSVKGKWYVRTQIRKVD